MPEPSHGLLCPHCQPSCSLADPVTTLSSTAPHLSPPPFLPHRQAGAIYQRFSSLEEGVVQNIIEVEPLPLPLPLPRCCQFECECVAAAAGRSSTECSSWRCMATLHEASPAIPQATWRPDAGNARDAVLPLPLAAACACAGSCGSTCAMATAPSGTMAIAAGGGVNMHAASARAGGVTAAAATGG